MKRDRKSVHVVTTKRAHKGKVYRTHLLMRSYREDGKVKKETVANITSLGDDIVELVRQALRGVKHAPVQSLFEIVSSRPHGNVEAVLCAMRRLGFARLLNARKCPERSLIMALVAQRILAPRTKLATTREWHSTTLAEQLGVADANEDDLYAAMDWLLQRKDRIEGKLARRHLSDDSLVMFDLTSSYFEGSACPLAARGYSRDRKQGKLQVNYGLLTDERGCPVAVSVFSGNTGDPKTLMPQVEKLRGRFGLHRFVMVGDRGMITGKQIKEMRGLGGIDWITALRSQSIRKLLEGGHIQLELFDERNLFELEHADFPGERLIACRNPGLAKRRKHKRTDLLEATGLALGKIARSVQCGRLKGKPGKTIGVAVGKVVNKYKVAKHIVLDIGDGHFGWSIDEASVTAEAALDGLYVIRTSVAQERLSAGGTVRSYKRLSRVERAFRTLKTVDIHVRPIHHRTADRVRAHIFLCALAYYVRWHMEQAWRELLFTDEQPPVGDPVAPAQRSAAAMVKVRTHKRADGGVVHNFRTLMQKLATVVRNRSRLASLDGGDATVDVLTRPDGDQRRALELVGEIQV